MNSEDTQPVNMEEEVPIDDKEDAPAVEPASEPADADAVKAKVQTIKERLTEKSNALNEAIANGMRTNATDDEDEDEEDSQSDEEVDDMLNCTTDASGTTVPAHSATTIRTKPPPTFISIEEESEIRQQLKDSKLLRRKLRKMKKTTKRSMKGTQYAAAALDTFITFTNAVAADNACTDASIAQLTQKAKDNIHAFRDSTAFLTYSNRIGEHILNQIKPLIDHTKLLSTVGKERQVARDRRIKLETAELDVGDEQQYLKAMEVVHEFEEKDRAYKDEFKSMREHSSSHIGQMLKCYLVESATFLEQLSAVLRSSAQFGAEESWYLRDECTEKYRSNVVDSSGVSDGNTVALSLATQPSLDTRAAVPPSSTTAADTAMGIPVMETDGRTAEPYGSAWYSRTHNNNKAQAVRQGTPLTPSVGLTSGGDDGVVQPHVDYIRVLEVEYGLQEWGLSTAAAAKQKAVEIAEDENQETPAPVTSPAASIPPDVLQSAPSYLTEGEGPI